MLSIAEYNPFFIKKSFNLPDYNSEKRKRKLRKPIVEEDSMFCALFNKIYNHDIAHIDYKFNERQEKVKIATEIEKIKLKPKLKEEVELNLMYEKNINLKTLNVLCMFYKINLLYVKDNIFIKMFYNQPNTDIIYMNYKTIEPNEIDITSKYEVNLDKPLRCASYYKVDDLKIISTQLHLPIENIKKQQLYDSIYNVLDKLII
jgi:hypothetical protein